MARRDGKEKAQRLTLTHNLTFSIEAIRAAVQAALDDSVTMWGFCDLQIQPFLTDGGGHGQRYVHCVGFVRAWVVAPNGKKHVGVVKVAADCRIFIKNGGQCYAAEVVVWYRTQHETGHTSAGRFELDIGYGDAKFRDQGWELSLGPLEAWLTQSFENLQSTLP